MRLGKRKAAEEAIRIARAFVARHGGEGWACVGPKPDTLAPGWRRRKNVVKWTVLFDASSGGMTSDGPVVVLVDLDAKEARFL